MFFTYAKFDNNTNTFQLNISTILIKHATNAMEGYFNTMFFMNRLGHF